MEGFRAEVREWLEISCPASLRDGRGREISPPNGGGRESVAGDTATWLHAMADRGWTVPHWPTTYGGGGLDAEQVGILGEELKRINARPALAPLNSGIQMLGPLLLEHGTPEQCARFLPPIARGETRWCQGYSEPSAGSDLASLSTRAERTAIGYQVTGHKIWSSYAHLCDWIFCLVRTSDEHKQGGISFLLIDLQSPGIVVEPITLISGKSDFCEVFLDHVDVPAENLVGGEGQGWTIAKRLLQHERSMLGGAGGGLSGASGSKGLSLLDVVKERATQLGAADAGALSDRYAAHLIRLRALKATTARYADEHRRDAATPSVLKLASTELNIEREDLFAELAGFDAMVWDDDAAPDGFHGRARSWLRSRANSIEGGTSEIQLNIIAKHALGLPDAGAG